MGNPSQDHLPPSTAPRFPLAAAPFELAGVLAGRRKGIDSIRERQVAVIRSLVRHAAATVPVYRDLYPAGVADDLRTIGDLRALPTVDKQLFLARPPEERRSSCAYPGETSVSTSGSTGQPFRIYKTPFARHRNWLHSIIMMRAMEIGFRDSQLSMSPRPRTFRSNRFSGKRYRLNREQPAAEIAAALLEIQPDWINGHPHQLVEAGWHLGGKVRPRTVTTYGVTTGPGERAAIEELYGTPPIDIFGTAESSFFAWQCVERDLYHLTPELVYLEVLDDDGLPVPDGELGHLVITPLVNIAMPFLRYRMGDSVAMATRSCRCGYSLPCIETIQGRTFDWIVSSTGERIPPQRLQVGWVIDDSVIGLRRYKVHQRADGSVLLSVMAGEMHELDIEGWRRGYEKILGQPTEIELVEEIPLDRTGKFRQFTSEVAATQLAIHP